MKLQCSVLLTITDSLPVTTKLLESGLKYSAYECLRSKYKFNVREFANLVRISTSTAQRRRHQGAMSFRESELLIRYAKLLDAALDLMDGDVELALDWLQKPALHFGGESPLSVSITSVGAEEVLSFVSRLSLGSCN